MNIAQCNEAAIRLRDSCLSDPSCPDEKALAGLIDAARGADPGLAAAAASALIRIVVEELSDRFEPRLAECYVELFSRVIEAVMPEFSGAFLRKRYQDLCASPARPLASGPLPRHLIVLSRITLGADIAVTSIFLAALSRRFPQSTLWFAGPSKNFELFAGIPGLRHWRIDYPRGGSLLERFLVVRSLEGAFDAGDTWLVDPDSRISQLGLVPVAPVSSSIFFESRTFGSDSGDSLGRLTSAWCGEHLRVSAARPIVAPGSALPAGFAGEHGYICVSLGVGNNEAKRLSAAFEAKLLKALAATGRRIVVDAGAGGAEAESVREAVVSSGLNQAQCRILGGSFAAFCEVLRSAALYVGYDSAGQHAAAALGVPGITLFKGFANERMFERWQPFGDANSRVIRIAPPDDEASIELETVSAARELLG